MNQRQSDQPCADLVFVNGRVHSLDLHGTKHSALAVRGDRIVAVDADDVRALTGDRTRVIDLAGRAIIPGINDSHLHAAWYGAMWPGSLFGAGADPEVSPVRLSTREERLEALRLAGRRIAELGITSYTEPGIGPGEHGGETGCFGPEVLSVYRHLDEGGELTARVSALLLFGILDGPSSRDEVVRGIEGARADQPSPARMFRIGGVKIFADGIPPMRQAWIHDSYSDGSSGDLLIRGADLAEREAGLRAMIRAGHTRGLQVGVHATGDRSIAACVDEMSRAEQRDPRGLRHYIIHGDLVRKAELESMARAGIGINMQAGIATATSDWAAAELGREAIREAWPIGLAQDLGVDVSLSSDAPVLPPDWRVQIREADRWLGEAEDRDARMLALLRAYTAIPARQDGAEAWKGTIAPGMVADLCVLADDPFTLGPERLTDAEVQMTVCGGRIVFEREVRADAATAGAAASEGQTSS